MKPFQLPGWRKTQIRDKYRKKDSVIRSAVVDMEKAMHEAVAYVLDHWLTSGRYAEPTLNAMFAASDRFYRRVIADGYEAASAEKRDSAGRMRLKKRVKKLPDLEDVLYRGKLWSGAQKRSRKLTERLRKQYLKKLRTRFHDILPMLKDGKIDPAQAKQQMMKAWQASKPRVETIFRTETTNYFGKAQVEFFGSDPEIIGFMFDSVRDTSRTPICRSRHGLVYRPGTRLLTQNTPALHFNCRSHLIALANTPYNRTLLADPERDPEKRRVKPLPSGWRK